MKLTISLILGGAASLATGCGESQPPAQQKPASFSNYAAPARTTETPVQPAAPSPTTELVKAEVGVGKKGRGYGGGMMTEPIRQYFLQQDKLSFTVYLVQAMSLYKAVHDDKGPKTHEIFMKDIIEANSIKLPELPEGHRYIYDPVKEELMVEIPVDGNQTKE